MKAFTRNVLTYSASIHPSAEQLESLLPKFDDSTPLAASEVQRVGFVPLADERVVLPIGLSWATGLRIDRKSVPGSAVRRALSDRIERITKTQGFAPGRRQAKEIKEDVVAELTRKALVTSTVVPVLYSSRRCALYIAGSTKAADLVLNALVTALEAVEFKTVVIDSVTQGLTRRLSLYLDGGVDAFHRFGIGGSVVLEDEFKHCWSIKQSTADNAGETLQEALDHDAQVHSIELELPTSTDTPIVFRFTNKLRVVGVKHGDSDPENEYADDLQAAKISQLALELGNLDAIWNGLMELFDAEDIQSRTSTREDDSTDLF